MTGNTELIQIAIEQQLVVVFSYDDSERRLEPHLLGYNTRDNLTLSAWQLSGGSGVGWRDFIVPNISNLVLTEEKFLGARPGFNPNDRTMRRILMRLGEKRLAR